MLIIKDESLRHVVSKTKKEDRCFYCDKKDRKTNHHWQCTCVDIESKKTVQFYVCPECLEKIYKGLIKFRKENNDR